ncbi:hypothetical protein ABB37_05551 [Leptomonas pyrrhocoris]|uniref:Uncharacterized protein n=1 Tax=Leptomonas pyrrhocoris TaxID=157538 RepID=A0A0M9FZB9_LEPPY|nr:hypothetical protein ABB37_05551 [Leptomonas pyrrhocoris]XP_015657448.1 hypothetical protein ABB37_05551 [Leptomonas pyrrhocoris]KPA79008.1 hypothetical protein ABB37_05551 [Leptomonas pyrrhocoris]KPA79009.1 hypothetical protein ABB37_05551 [Leptomonas pyrrhocoris]|eukprot:XP_015657447.1 hypothetical protein ABB37_05551 [Leptomonas pyrrhocoris]
MATLEKLLQSSSLSAQCKSDLRSHVSAVNEESKRLPKQPPTEADADLPSATQMPTDNSFKRRLNDADMEASKERSTRYVSRKQDNEEMVATLSAMSANPSGSYYKKCSTRFVCDDGTRRDPFQASRSRGELSGKDNDFVHRYAEALTKSSIERPAPSDDASVTATEAYKAAFREYTGREPSAKDLAEVDRLTFAFDENGGVGVTQKPHSCYPHMHISSTKTPTTRCTNQVYQPEAPAVRAARSQFPGPIPTWSTTKRSPAVATNGTYQADHQVPMSIKRAALDTMVGSK